MTSTRFLRYCPTLKRYTPSRTSFNLADRFFRPPPPLDDPEAIVTPPPPPRATSPRPARAREYLGIELPTKPPAPQDGECCMSGCAHCVYDVYLEDVQLYHERLAETKSRLVEILESSNSDSDRLAAEEWPSDVLGDLRDALHNDGQRVGPEELAERELERARQALDPATRAFLEMEAKMKKKQQLAA